MGKLIRHIRAIPRSFFRAAGGVPSKGGGKVHSPDRGLRIVDLGCGHGTLLHFLKQAGYTNVLGIDVSGEQIEQARRLGVNEARQGQLDAFLSDADPGSVDVVLMFDVLEHLRRQELFRTLDGVRRILRSKGWCIVHLPNAEGIYGMRIRYGDLTHEISFTPRSLQQLFATVGFSGVACFEDKPQVHGFSSALRRIVWEIGTFPHRLLLTAETGQTHFVLSQNMLAVARVADADKEKSSNQMDGAS